MSDITIIFAKIYFYFKSILNLPIFLFFIKFITASFKSMFKELCDNVLCDFINFYLFSKIVNIKIILVILQLMKFLYL